MSTLSLVTLSTLLDTAATTVVENTPKAPAKPPVKSFKEKLTSPTELKFTMWQGSPADLDATRAGVLYGLPDPRVKFEERGVQVIKCCGTGGKDGIDHFRVDQRSDTLITGSGDGARKWVLLRGLSDFLRNHGPAIPAGSTITGSLGVLTWDGKDLILPEKLQAQLQALMDQNKPAPAEPIPATAEIEPEPANEETAA